MPLSTMWVRLPAHWPPGPKRLIPRWPQRLTSLRTGQGKCSWIRPAQEAQRSSPRTVPAYARAHRCRFLWTGRTLTRSPRPISQCTQRSARLPGAIRGPKGCLHHSACRPDSSSTAARFQSPEWQPCTKGSVAREHAGPTIEPQLPTQPQSASQLQRSTERLTSYSVDGRYARASGAVSTDDEAGCRGVSARLRHRMGDCCVEPTRVFRRFVQADNDRRGSRGGERRVRGRAQNGAIRCRIRESVLRRAERILSPQQIPAADAVVAEDFRCRPS